MSTSIAEDSPTTGLSRSLWWLLVTAGVLWVLWGMFVLTYKPGALTSLAVLVGISFIIGGVDLVITSTVVTEWRWLWIAGGILGIIAGVIVFFQPGSSLYVIAVFVAWYLAIAGVFAIVGAFMGEKRDWWWLGIVLGILEIALGVWAIGSPTREILLLVNLMGFGMLFFGINQIVRGFTLRSAS
jgi:uncharacterized membrane protein HdeD (DUF308 family)